MEKQIRGKCTQAFQERKISTKNKAVKNYIPKKVDDD
jgi:hypothetical protein